MAREVAANVTAVNVEDGEACYARIDERIGGESVAAVGRGAPAPTEKVSLPCPTILAVLPLAILKFPPVSAI